VTADIDPETGYLVSANCPQHMTEVFIQGSAPAQECPVHRPHVAQLSPQ